MEHIGSPSVPGLAAKRHNPRLNAWAETLSQRGLTGKQVIVAVMRTQLHLAYGVIKSGQPFDPHYQSAKPQPINLLIAA